MWAVRKMRGRKCRTPDAEKDISSASSRPSFELEEYAFDLNEQSRKSYQPASFTPILDNDIYEPQEHRQHSLPIGPTLRHLHAMKSQIPDKRVFNSSTSFQMSQHNVPRKPLASSSLSSPEAGSSRAFDVRMKELQVEDQQQGSDAEIMEYNDDEFEVVPLDEDVGTTRPSFSFDEAEPELELEREPDPLIPIHCPPRGSLYSVVKWFGRGVLALLIFLVLGALAMLVIAQKRPTWSFIRPNNHGILSPSSATFTVTMFARVVVSAFSFCFTLCLGQILTRRGIEKDSRGMSLDDIFMRDWIIQPALIFFKPRILVQVFTKWIAFLCFVGVITMIFYTTAAVVLVSPVLILGPPQDQLMWGVVETSYANPNYVETTCQSPITYDEDPEFAAATCLEMEHSGQAYHNFLGYTTVWASISGNGTAANTNENRWMDSRPSATANLYDNTTVQGSWVETSFSNMTEANLKYSRVVNNVTMTMPHSGLFAAAKDSKNGITQPTDVTDSIGYEIHASVPGPTVNVLCVNAKENELAPLVYTQWPRAEILDGFLTDYQIEPLELEQWENSNPWPEYNIYGNATVLDDIFGWGEKYDRQHPSFPMFPSDYNILMASMTNFSSDSMHLIAKSPETSNYTVCSLRSYLNPNCYTSLNISGDFGRMTSTCSDSGTNDSVPTKYSVDWVIEATELALALSWNDGIDYANSSNARMLTELITTAPSLNPLAPSMAEALAVQAGCTLLLGSLGSPFIQNWEYGTDSLHMGIYQSFNATIREEVYTSTWENEWQKTLLIPLYSLEIGSIALLIWFIKVWFFASHNNKNGLVCDYTVLQNLFPAAINSPPSDLLAGACIGGPTGNQNNYPWYVRTEPRTGHVYIEGQLERGAREGDQVDDYRLNLPRRLSRAAFDAVVSIDTMSRRRSQAPT